MKGAAFVNLAIAEGKVSIGRLFFVRNALMLIDVLINPPSFPLSSFVLEKFWFCRLSLNHKVLHYGDLDESPQGEVPFELLSDKSKMLQTNPPHCT